MNTIYRPFDNHRNIRLGRISYMNVAPVYYGINDHFKPSWIDIVSAPPATLNRMLSEGRLDVSPVSSFSFARHQDQWMILPNLSVACDGEVMSVILVSRLPIWQLSGKYVLITEESETAAHLLKLLLKMHNVTPHYIKTKVRRPEHVHTSADAALIIGDAALRTNWRLHFPHVHDLGRMWKTYSGLPFVFALWAVRRQWAQSHPQYASSLMHLLDASRQKGLCNLNPIADNASQMLGLSQKICQNYYKGLYYDLDMLKRQSLQRFFDELRRHHLISKPVKLSFFDEQTPAYTAGHAA